MPFCRFCHALARKTVLTLHYIVFIPGLIAGFVVSSAVCVGGSLCLKLKKTYVELELRSTKSEHFKTGNVALQTVQVFMDYKRDHFQKELDEWETKHKHFTDQMEEDIQRKSLLTNEIAAKVKGFNEAEYEWLKTLCIDNPLNPYRNLYKRKLGEINAGSFLTAKDMEKIFKGARKISYTGAIISLITFFIVVPAVALGQTVLSKVELTTWILICQHWCLIVTVLVVTIPPIQECWQIWKRYKLNKETKS